MRQVNEEVKGACQKINALAILTEDPQIRYLPIERGLVKVLSMR